MTPRRKPVDDDDAGGDAPPDDDAGGDVDEDRIRGIVRDVLSELNIGGAGAGGDDAPLDDDGDKPAARKGTQASVEADVESQVRAAIDKLRTEDDRDKRLSALEAKVETTPERAPVKERISTRFMGWNRKAGV